MEFYTGVIKYREIDMVIYRATIGDEVTYVFYHFVATTLDPHIYVAGDSQVGLWIVLGYTLSFEYDVAETILLQLSSNGGGFACHLTAVVLYAVDNIKPL